MDMGDHNSLLQPFIPVTTAAATVSRSTSAATAAALSSFHHNNDCNYTKPFSSNKSVIIRLLLVLSVAAISLWANYEASKTFEITLINDAKDSPAGRRFDIFYVSNDRATRILLNASSFVQHLLYDHPDPHHYPKKHIRHVTLRLASRNLNAAATVTGKHDPGGGGGGNKFNGYVVDLSPSLLEEANYREALVPAVLSAMARVWLWDGASMAPARLIDGVVEYVAAMAGFGGGKFSGAVDRSPVHKEGEDSAWWEDEEPREVARFLRCCEGHKEGFIRQLNEALMDTWHYRIVDDALGMPAKKLCGFYNASWAPQKNTTLRGSM